VGAWLLLIHAHVLLTQLSGDGPQSSRQRAQALYRDDFDSSLRSE